MERSGAGSKFTFAGRPRRSGFPAGLERLEARQLLAAVDFAAGAADPPTVSALNGVGPSDGIERIEWQGHVVEARVDHWTGRLAANGDDLAAVSALRGLIDATHPGWHAASLTGGSFSLATPGASRQDVLLWATAQPSISVFEPDFIFRAAAVPNDPSFSSQWGLLNSGQYAGTSGSDIGASRAWQITTGSRSVVVGVVDSGIDITHPDLAANIWTNPGEIPGNRLDDDHNGYVDDVHGWNFVDDTNLVIDVYGHGTHVAGIIGAEGNNARGVAGVAWQVSLLPLKFQDSRGVGSTSSMLAALNYATMMRRDHGINIVATNNSWQTTAGYSAVVEEVIRRQGEAGIMFVAAAGNNASDNDATPRYPGSYALPNVITVAALSPANTLASMSNFGRTSVHLAAPGALIQSTFPGGSYGMLSGTSMAAPHVTGVVALLAAARPGITIAQARTAILGSTLTVAALAGKTATGGRLDARRSLEAIVGALPTPGSPPVVPTPVAPTPVAPVAPTLPFADSFTGVDGPLRADRWTQRTGRVNISTNTAISRTSGSSLLLLRGPAPADVRLRANVMLGSGIGQSVGLVARQSGAGEGSMYLGRLVKRPAGWIAQIWVRDQATWRLLGMRRVSQGTGTLQFDVVGSRLTLSFKGRSVVDLHDTTIARPGAVGVRTTGLGSRLDDFSAA